MAHRTYHPDRGDLVHLNFAPSAGHELTGRHYALVLSPLSYNRRSGMALVCGITSRVHGWAFEVPLPGGMLPDKAGVGTVSSVVLADAIRQIDYREREIALVARAPKAIVTEVMDKLLALLEAE
jgi:mRNA interferase MazF